MRPLSYLLPSVVMTALVGLGSMSACRGDDSPNSDDRDGGGDLDAANPYAVPETNVVPSIGRDDLFEIASWNIKNFPRQSATPKMVADLIASMDLDVVAVQEIEDTAGFDELVLRLRGYSGVLSSHTYGNGNYQKIGFIYKTDLVSIESGTLLFPQDGYEFPRPPLQVIVTIDNGSAPAFDLIAITLHLKAGRDADDRARRRAAMILLEEHVRTNSTAIDSDVILLGDFNEVVTNSGGREVFDPFIVDNPSLYALETEAFASNGGVTFVPSGSALDHAISTASIADELGGGQVVIPPLNDQYLPYNGSVSDHLPVILTMPIF